tara:strand:- start:288 stop:638 length:351 start_codon:yes stop_codon:yes gene_type:complete
MKNNNKLFLEKLISLSKSSEIKYKNGNFKGAIEDKREVRFIIKDNSIDEKILKKWKKELLLIYESKFDLINDHKVRINENRRNEIINLLEKKSEEKYKKGDFKGAIKALRRSEKYL